MFLDAAGSRPIYYHFMISLCRGAVAYISGGAVIAGRRIVSAPRCASTILIRLRVSKCLARREMGWVGFGDSPVVYDLRLQAHEISLSILGTDPDKIGDSDP